MADKIKLETSQKKTRLHKMLESDNILTRSLGDLTLNIVKATGAEKRTKEKLEKIEAEQIKKDLEKNYPLALEKFRVDAKDRKYQFWQRNPLSIDLYSSKVLEQKLDYIHANPVQQKWNLGDSAIGYKYSSIRFYEEGDNEWTFLKNYMDEF